MHLIRGLKPYLNKFISSTGICSHREAEKLIIEGRVTIDGKATQLGNRDFEGDEVTVSELDGRPLKPKPKTIYIALNKPIGIVCTCFLLLTLPRFQPFHWIPLFF